MARYTGDPATHTTVRHREGRVAAAPDVTADENVAVVSDGFAADFLSDRGDLFPLSLAR